MTQPRAAKRPKGVPGVKALLTAASLTATLGGWAALTAAEPPPAPEPGPTPPPAEAALPPLDLPALPTLVPLLPPAGAGTRQAAPAPVPPVAARPAPPLRVVQVPPPGAAPPRALTRTRSSR